jgi:hypothetical protein
MYVCYDMVSTTNMSMKHFPFFSWVVVASERCVAFSRREGREKRKKRW